MPPIIEVAGLVKRYRKATRNAVDGISFRVEAGELFALLGPNGAGKTTTISILTTTLAPTSGKVCIAGYDIWRRPKARTACASWPTARSWLAARPVSCGPRRWRITSWSILQTAQR